VSWRIKIPIVPNVPNVPNAFGRSHMTKGTICVIPGESDEYILIEFLLKSWKTDSCAPKCLPRVTKTVMY
jgi:hypothetical protein